MYNGLALTGEANKSFYPTPPELAAKLVDGLHWRKITDVLEPSAGTGNLITAMVTDMRGMDINRINIDAIEIDPSLRAILMSKFSQEACDKLAARREELRLQIRDKQLGYDPTPVSEEEQRAYDEIYYDCSTLRNLDVRVVHDDFNTFDTKKHYDLILMNPPFDIGDRFLLKAIQMQKRYGGHIRCILNAETIKNPYTMLRQTLIKELETLGAEISFEVGAFENAERQTDVEIAIIKIDIAPPVRESDIYSRLKKAEEEKEYKREATELVVNDTVRQILMSYQIEINAGCELIRQYIDLKPYIQKSMSGGSAPILELSVNGKDGADGMVNRYIKAVRKKYWSALFQNPQFVGQLTSNLQNELWDQVEEFSHYEFSEFNIRAILANMNCKMYEGIRDTILELFEKLTTKHAFFEDGAGNVHYFNGWKTNKCHKVNEKVILPVNGIFSTYSWEQDAFSVRNAVALLSDIKKALNYLDGNITTPVDLEATLAEASRCGETKNIKLKFFYVTFYKKGTMHLKFRNSILLDRFNIYCCQNKNWLPPNYGKKTYSDLDQEEKAVVDSFNGTGEEGSGAMRYDSIVAHSGYYLAPPATSTLKLEGEVE